MTSGRRAGCHLSESWMEHICSDNAVGAHRISHFLRLRTFAATAFFAYFLELSQESKSDSRDAV
jgi:hypothetical protein